MALEQSIADQKSLEPQGFPENSPDLLKASQPSPDLLATSSINNASSEKSPDLLKASEKSPDLLKSEKSPDLLKSETPPILDQTPVHSTQEPPKPVYHLQSIVRHKGSTATHGHYVTGLGIIGRSCS